MRDVEIFKSESLAVRKSAIFEVEQYMYYDLDVISGPDVMVSRFVELYLDQIAEQPNGTILYIDGSEETMEDAMNGRVVCYFKNGVSSVLVTPEVWNLPVRFASVKVSKNPRGKFENLTLFVPSRDDGC